MHDYTSTLMSNFRSSIFEQRIVLLPALIKVTK